MGIISPFKLIQALSAPTTPDIRERIGVVTVANPLTLLMEGESAGEELVVTSLASCSPQVGDRVACIKIGRSWVAASVIGFPLVRSACKSANETVSSSANFHNDGHLVLPMEAKTSYGLFMQFDVQSTAVADFKFNFTGPSGFIPSVSVTWGPINAGAAVFTCSTTLILSITDGTTHPFIIAGKVICDTTPGNLQFQWAQATSTAVNTTVFKGAYMTLIRTGTFV
jgi:hypothetical protein